MTTLLQILNEMVNSGDQDQIGLNDGARKWYAETYIDETFAAGGGDYLDKEAYADDKVIRLVEEDGYLGGIEFYIEIGHWDEETGEFVEEGEDE